MEYRKDIQMLRGVAVALVVLFHLGVVGFSSGFLGVDVFFVISGYLMEKLYDPSNKADFFLKRARRLLPAYFATVIVTVLAALAITVPSDYAQVATQAVFASFFASNIGFWLDNSYFDKDAFKPLLHLWSLGVEIQFYLLIPALCWFFRKVRFGYLLLLAGSLILCFAVVGVSPKTSFFWLPLRLWEFLIGFGIARHVYKGRNATLAWVGFAALAIVACIPLVPVDSQALGFLRGHPGLLALLITLATGTTLAFGLPKRLENMSVSSALEKLGDYSYSIYLVHYPVIVLVLYQPFLGTILKSQSIGQSSLLALLVVVGSALLYQCVEHPFRKRTSQVLLRWSVASAIALLSIGYFGFVVQRLTTPKAEMLVYAAWTDRGTYRCGKIYRIIHPTAISCEISNPIENPTRRVLLVGNSNADSIKSTFTEAAQARGVAVYFMVQNNPLMPGGLTAQAVIKEAQSRAVDSIVLHYSPGGLELTALDEVAMLSREHGIRLSLIMPVPIWDRHIPKALLDKSVPSQDIRDYRRANSALIAAVARADFNVYQTADVLCTKVCMTASESGRPLYFDRGHLTLTGSNLLRGVFDRVIDDLQGPIVSKSRHDS